MIVISMPLQREFVKELLNDKTFEGITYRFVKQEGMKLFFEVTPNSDAAIKVTKNTIKASKYGSSLNFMVDYV